VGQTGLQTQPQNKIPGQTAPKTLLRFSSPDPHVLISRLCSGLDVIAAVAKLPAAGFVPGSESGHDTRALPALWKEMPKVKELNDKMVAETGKLAVAAKSGNLDQLKAAFGPAAQTCKACHDDFRKK